MSSRQLKTAGILAMASALLAIPWFLMVYVTEDHQSVQVRGVEAALLVCGTALYVYLLSMLRKLLLHQFAFTAASPYVALLIKGNVVITAIGLLGLSTSAIQSSVAIVTIILAVPLGIVQAMFGRKLLSLPHDLNGLRNALAWLNIVTGLCQASIALMPVALFTGAVADVMLGTIFLQAAARARTYE